jgi:septum formation protein
MKSVMPKLYLASTSPARQKILEDIGLSFTVLTPTVDEEHAVREMREPPTAEAVALHLAKLKAESVLSPEIDGLILGGDSVFDFGGGLLGKPLHADIARERWLKMRGNQGILYSGLWVIDHTGGMHHKATGGTSHAIIHFSDSISNAEIDAYVETGEPLKVAGAFTLDSKGAAFIDKVEGDPYAVIGLSAATLRTLVLSLGYSYHEFWE